MNSSFDTSDMATSEASPSSILGVLWTYYVQYLWDHESGSWVARIAYSCRILAILVCFPIIILGLLDIASYGIARTLGVIDDVKASTSDKATVHDSMTPPITITPGSESAFSDSDCDSLTDHTIHNKMRSPLSDYFLGKYENTNFSQPPVFYAGEEDNNLRLSGVGVFSPAASQPPSPTLSRYYLPQAESSYVKEQLRHRAQQQRNELKSTSDENQ